jgi:hypothetical protein
LSIADELVIPVAADVMALGVPASAGMALPNSSKNTKARKMDVNTQGSEFEVATQ